MDVVTGRSLKAGDGLGVEVGGETGRSWRASISQHTPQEFILSFAEEVARCLRHELDTALGTAETRDAETLTSWPAADGCAIDLDAPGAQMHVVPTGQPRTRCRIWRGWQLRACVAPT
ncbi:hypothetical protein KV557_35385 [Kitasatospora aureofaciens]|uniref:hypothetical protein n=1 Tax=Kitasatospora aureofaciens TaxID=1894 RepID=UPI001C474830|nr:hypothetical protein [Kitasatospora aureofaciens]MBV6702327.1 hypothetical protein [Kitasatospora aureofaciens]